MEFLLDKGSGDYRIKSYYQGIFTVNEITYSTSIIVMPDLIISPWGPTSLRSLQASDFDKLLDLKPQVVLLGTGQQLQFPKPSFFSLFAKQEIGLEVMDTQAACRTYAVLMSEGRKVAAALLP